MSYEDIPIIRSNRRSISIQILPGKKVVVKAPHYIPEFIIRRFLKQKSGWIQKQLDRSEVNTPVPKKVYAEGETYWYLGKSYTLKYATVTQITCQGSELLFPQALVFRIQKELHAWYIREAKRIITDSVNENAKYMHAQFKTIRFSDTASKWGSCSPDNRLQFNWRLVMAPMLVIHYVVVHELAHTKEKNHGTQFWELVASVTPSYKQQRKWLKKHGDMLIV